MTNLELVAAELAAAKKKHPKFVDFFFREVPQFDVVGFELKDARTKRTTSARATTPSSTPHSHTHGRESVFSAIRPTDATPAAGSQSSRMKRVWGNHRCTSSGAHGHARIP